VFSPAKRRAWFYSGMAVAALMVVFSGFGSRFYLRPVDLPALSIRVIAHATLFSTWVLLFVAQTLLVSTGQTAAHRRLGLAAAVVAAVMVVSSPPLAIGLARRGGPVGADPLAFFLIIVTDVVLFGVFVTVALVWRRRRELHKRLMLLAMIVVMPASISRWPIAVKNPAPVIGGVLLAFILAMVVNDVATRRRPHPATIVGGLVVLLSQPLRFAVSQTAAWHRFAAWLIR
jgi:uncharacterized membrane protein YozB (DUF420 family)